MMPALQTSASSGPSRVDLGEHRRDLRGPRDVGAERERAGAGGLDGAHGVGRGGLVARDS